MEKNYEPTCQFQTIKNAAHITGLSQYFLRKGCVEGTIPHIRLGNKYMINMPLMLQRINEQSENNICSGK